MENLILHTPKFSNWFFWQTYILTLNLSEENYNINGYSGFKVKVFPSLYISFIFRKETKTKLPYIVSYIRDFKNWINNLIVIHM